MNGCQADTINYKFNQSIYVQYNVFIIQLNLIF
jgi:hypothetical protein